ncbi:MAG: flagellar biosynthesis protein FlhB [Bacillaceae bacterium]|nr:flagellar biosynthesis protein FlhB [Bacillaceae bacterium]
MPYPTRRYPVNLQFFAQEKTEKATPRKKQEARKKGQVAKSMEIPSALIMLFAFISFIFLGQMMLSGIIRIYQQTLSEYILWQVTPNNIQVMFMQLTWESVKLVSPVLLVAMVAAIFANYIQIGFLFTTEPLKMKLNKLNPIEGAKKIFSWRALVEFVKSILKFVFVTLVVAIILWNAKEQILNLSVSTPGGVLQVISGLTAKLGVFVALLLIVLAVADYVYQRYDHEKSLRMSKQDIKDEHKKTEGDPLIKSKIKEKQREMAMRRMMQEVPKADVVITNPTHFALALRYDSETMTSPTVVAKGKDHLAEKIKEVAREHDVVTMENKPLARALYFQVEIGEEIPEDLFKAVAEVLAYVYKLKGKV